MTTRAGRVPRGLSVIAVVLGLLVGASVTMVPRTRAVSSSAKPGHAGSARLVRASHPAAAVITTPASVVVGSVTRDYLLGGAAAVPGGEAPLLVLFHGLDQPTPSFLGDVNILAAAARAGVVVAAPISPDEAWNDGRFGVDGPDDDGFAMAIIATLAASGTIDPGRVTVAGFSNGAGMAIELASRHPSAIAALVSVDGELLSAPDATLPSGPIPAYFIHGTNDPIQPIGGRPFLSDRKPGYVSEQATIAGFLAADGEAGVSPTRVSAPRHRGLSVGPVTITRWAGEGPAPVTFASIAGMGHKWPALSCGPPSARTKADKRKAAARRAAMAALLPAAGVAGCESGGGPNTRASDLSANSLILGVAVGSRLGSVAL